MKAKKLKHFVTWRTDSLKGITYEEARADAASRVNGSNCSKGRVYILEVVGVANPVPPPVRITPYKEGL